MRTRSIFTLLPVLISCASSPYTEEIDHGLNKPAFITYYATHKVDEIFISPQSYT